jgi:hypothetical protein
MSHPLQNEIDKMVRDLLGKNYLELSAASLAFEEDFTTERVRIKCQVASDGKINAIVGEGVGLIDAFFNGLQANMVASYPSLKTIEFADFSVKSDISTKRARTGSEMAARIELTVENAERKRFTFSHASRSITHSSVEVTMQAIAYFVNSERAFLQVRQALEHAKRENRQDTIQRYTAILAQLVENTSYSEAIAKTK